jgi:glycerol uptake facilitator-like aquaporin
MFGRKQLAILVAEFLGTGALALVMLSVQHSTIGLPYFVALLAGLTVAVMTIVIGRGGAGHFNPAITVGMWTVRQIKTIPAISYIVVQMLGAWAAYYLYTYFVRTKLSPVGGHYDAHILVAEAVGAFVLALAWSAAVFGKYWSSKAAASIGAAYVLAIVIASAAGIGIVNPAIALSMRAFDVFGSMGWGTYVLGPVLGAIVAFNLYALLFSDQGSLAGVKAVVNSFGRTTTGSKAATVRAETPRRRTTRRRNTRRAR